jgi:hypothetical protein
MVLALIWAIIGKISTSGLGEKLLLVLLLAEGAFYD